VFLVATLQSALAVSIQTSDIPASQLAAADRRHRQECLCHILLMPLGKTEDYFTSRATAIWRSREHPVASIVQAWTLLEIRLESLKPRCTSLK
jgi:hypothetical protein